MKDAHLRVAEIVDTHEWSRLDGSTLGQQIADKLTAEGLLNQDETYAALGELTGGERIVLNDANTGPTIYQVQTRIDGLPAVIDATGDAYIYGARPRRDGGAPDEPTLLLVGPANMHVRKVSE